VFLGFHDVANIEARPLSTEPQNSPHYAKQESDAGTADGDVNWPESRELAEKGQFVKLGQEGGEGLVP